LDLCHPRRPPRRAARLERGDAAARLLWNSWRAQRSGSRDEEEQ